MDQRLGVFCQALGADAVEHGVGNADVGQHDLAAAVAAGLQQVAGLEAEEGDGHIGDRWPRRGSRPVAPSMPLGTSMLTTGRVLALTASMMLGKVAVDIAVEPGAEQRIDDEVGVVDVLGGRRGDAAGPLRGHGGRVALERCRGRRSGAAAPASRVRLSRRATTKPSPPLLPGPQSTSTERW